MGGAVRLAGDVGESAHGLGQGTEARPVFVGTRLAKAADSHHYQAWVDRLQILVADPPSLHGARAKTLYQNIRVFDQTLQYLRALRTSQVQSDALLVPGVKLPGQGYPILLRTHRPKTVAVLGMLDLDYLGAKVPH